MNSGIYIWINIINYKCYIGQAINFNRRKNDHETFHKSNILLTKSIKKYGIDNFIFDILEEVEPMNNLLNEAEKFWISYFKTLGYSLSNTLYNFRDGGQGTLGLKWSKKSKENQSIKRLGIKFSETHLTNLSLSHKGKISPKKLSIEKECIIINSLKNLNITQKELASILNIHRTTITNVLKRNDLI